MKKLMNRTTTSYWLVVAIVLGVIGLLANIFFLYKVLFPIVIIVCLLSPNILDKRNLEVGL